MPFCIRESKHRELQGKTFFEWRRGGIKITEKILYFKLFILLLFSDVECEDFMLDTFCKWTNSLVVWLKQLN